MSNSGIGVALVHEVCPICGKPMNESILMNSKIGSKYAKEVEEAHGKAIGYSENACKDCAFHKDDCIYVIEIDAEKSEPNNPYRTGMYWGLRKDFALFVEHPECILKTKDGVQFCFMDKEFAYQIGLPHENN